MLFSRMEGAIYINLLCILHCVSHQPVMLVVKEVSQTWSLKCRDTQFLLVHIYRYIELMYICSIYIYA